MPSAAAGGSEPSTPSQASTSDFAAAVLRVAVAQICQSVGFRSAESSALDSLASVLARYLGALAGSSAASANSARRTQCNLLDVAAAIERLRADTGGFPGAWDPSRRLRMSLPVREIARFVESAEEIPFAKPLRRERPAQRARTWRSFGQLGRTPPMKHVPAWLPAFPDCTAPKSEGCLGIAEREAEGSVERGRRGEGKGRVLPDERERVRFRVGSAAAGGGRGRARRRATPRFVWADVDRSIS